MKRSLALFFLALLCLVAGASCGGGGGGGGGDGTVAPGSPCTLEDFGGLRCGELDGRVVVIRCQMAGAVYTWTEIQVCAEGGTCENGFCVGGGADTLPDVILLDTNVYLDGVQAEAGKDTALDLDTGPFCIPGSLTCLSTTQKGICKDDGSDYRAEACPEGFFCDAGSCKEQVCTPGEPEGEGKCVAPTAYSVCNETGTDWTWAECEPGLSCYQGKCVSYKCPPDEVICKGLTAVQKCMPTEDGGYDWEVTELCANGLCKDGKCLGACEVNLKQESYLGCDYWAVDLDNSEGGQYMPVGLVVSAPGGGGDAAITVLDMSKVPAVELAPADLSVTAMDVPEGTLKVFMLPNGHDIDGSIQTNKSFRVKSTAPVTVHQFNPLNGEAVYSNDASLLLPSHTGGQEYYVLSWPMRTSKYTLRGFFAVVATQEGITKVSVTPTSATLKGVNVDAMQANPTTPYVFYLEQGDVLNVETDGAQGADLTGTKIVSDKKVNVLGGHECANIPMYPNIVDWCDHLEEQLFPVNTWGSRYMADAFAPRNGSQLDTWRIVSGAAGVNVNLIPSLAGPFKNLKKGQWVEFQTAQSFEISATGPIMVGHYMQGSNYPGASKVCYTKGSDTPTTGIGDPSLTLVVPVEQYLSEYVFLIPDAYQTDYVNVVKKKDADVLLDGVKVIQPFTNLGSDNVWAVAQVQIADGVHTITSSDVFGITAYGYDCDVSYAYPGGLNMKSMTDN